MQYGMKNIYLLISKSRYGRPLFHVKQKKGGIRLPYPTESQSTKKIVVDDNKLWINCVSKVSFNTV